MRSASPRCAIENIATRGLPFGRIEQARRVERLAFEPLLEPGRGQQAVEPHRELEALLRREERLEIEDADLVEGRRLDLLDERSPDRDRGRPPRPPPNSAGRSVCSRLRGGRLDAGERQHARCRCWRPVRRAARCRSRTLRRRGKRAEDRDRHAGAAAGRVDGEVGGVAQPLDARRRPGPSRRALPSSVAACCGGERIGATARAARFVFVDPRAEVLAAESCGNVSSRLPRSPLGSMAITGTPSIAASSMSARHSPVLPLPVMPTQTACVTRSRES